MKRKKRLDVLLLILAAPIGFTLYKHTDFKNFTFEKPYIDTLYLITFCALLFFALKKKDKEPEW
ncbi:MAG: hypothetical protein M9900_13160 [Flavobacteriales bacterium]|nr:hypothetical protein [Flavobacteriales bacterium]